MPMYEYRCEECGEVFSVLLRHYAEGAEPQSCPGCSGRQTRRLVSLFAVGGRVNPGPGRAAWPTSWEDTNGGDPETLRYWRRRIEREARLEEQYPELADPSLRHGAGTGTLAAAEHGHDQGQGPGGHGHTHHHDHGHGPAAHDPGPDAVLRNNQGTRGAGG
jgi:putative FmdB family regulatory protein